MVDKKKFALNYFDNGFIPIPLCWPEKEKCGCFMNHTDPKQIGKAPIVKYANMSISREMVEEWFTRYPEANIGILIRESGLVVVDCDSPEAVEEFETIWADTSLVPNVKTGRGKHFYFKAKTSTTSHRSIHKGKSGMIDVFSNGFIVAPPSVHKNGHSYVWSNPPKKAGVPNVPSWIERFLTIESTKKTADLKQLNSVEIEITDEQKKVILAEFPLNNFIKDIIRQGEKSPYYKERGYRSKSEALHGMMIACYERGLTDDEVFSIFSNPQYKLSYKYFENKCSATWLKDEMKRAKVKVKAKKNSRSAKNDYSHSHLQINSGKLKRKDIKL